ncbi:hypothetical protein MHYP_G00025050 [Metynnis hypsauchen]
MLFCEVCQKACSRHVLCNRRTGDCTHQLISIEDYDPSKSAKIGTQCLQISVKVTACSRSNPSLPHLLQCESWSTADSPPVVQVQFQVTVSSQRDLILLPSGP